uniref:AlNc14C154G7607 protein n=1 Tax=Albugo laibachii Nc14 TaxID=890382 RepID=F0WMA1_9STRA|nr:AlNc14C154G7607 [Albugo laibachii Nc14]|eukprot:CCA22432.1 AlNc14C154G7607 [Albugo laibachii Nc14]
MSRAAIVDAPPTRYILSNPVGCDWSALILSRSFDHLSKRTGLNYKVEQSSKVDLFGSEPLTLHSIRTCIPSGAQSRLTNFPTEPGNEAKALDEYNDLSLLVDKQQVIAPSDPGSYDETLSNEIQASGSSGDEKRAFEIVQGTRDSVLHSTQALPMAHKYGIYSLRMRSRLDQLIWSEALVHQIWLRFTEQNRRAQTRCNYTWHKGLSVDILCPSRLLKRAREECHEGSCPSFLRYKLYCSCSDIVYDRMMI